jgi:hypothetical protein
VDEDFVKKKGVRKAFHVGGNSSCRQHIRAHYDIYKTRCEEKRVQMNDWAIPRLIWKEMNKTGKSAKSQSTLDGKIERIAIPSAFTREGIVEAIAKHIVCDDQALSLADKATFRNCMVAMRPRTTATDLPSTHDVTIFIHNQFISLVKTLKEEILVRFLMHVCRLHSQLTFGSVRLGRSLPQLMAGLLIRRRPRLSELLVIGSTFMEMTGNFDLLSLHFTAYQAPTAARTSGGISLR